MGEGGEILLNYGEYNKNTYTTC